MGAIRGTIQADYSAFEAECDKAAAGLKAIETQGGATEQSLAKMEASVSSGKVSEAIAKTVANVDKAGTSAKASASSFGQLADAGRVADKTLNQFGVSLGPTIGTLDEFARVSTSTVASLGKLGTAVSIAGAAMAGWNIGRWIADLTGADGKIADFANTLLGRGSVAAETFAAKQDAIRIAIQNGYQGLPTYTQAIEFNAKAAANAAAQHVTSAARIGDFTREIQKATGGAAALRGEIDAGVMTVAEMTARFNVSARAIDFLKDSMTAARAEAADLARADEAAAKAAQQHADAVTKLQAQLFGTDLIEKAQQYQAALGPLSNLTRLSDAATASLNATLGDAIAAYTRAGEVAPQAMRDLYIETMKLPPIVAGLGAEWANVGTKVSATADGIIADMKRMQAEAAAYEAETQRMAAGAEQIAPPIEAAKEQQQQLTVAMRDFGDVASSAYERAIAGAQVFAAYAKAGIATSGSIGLGGYEFAQLQQTGVPGGMSGVNWANAAPASSQPWGNQNTLTVNVTNADEQGIADKLVGEMRRSGYRL